MGFWHEPRTRSGSEADALIRLPVTACCGLRWRALGVGEEAGAGVGA